MPKRSLVPAPVAIGAAVVPLAMVALAWAVDVMFALVLLGVLAIGGAVARVVMPAERAFAIRRRAVDVTTLAVLGVVLLFLAFTTRLG